MRPIRLEFAGLRSYRRPTVVEFDRLDLFAIIGDTGAGKSTIIEALSLALYGKKTWSGGSNLAGLISDGENTMAITLVFSAEGNEWTVTRSRHRNAAAPVNRLIGSNGEKIDGNKEVNARIEELLGLDHSQFIRAVVLPQGRFDELLQATRTDRNKILRSIFGLDDLRRVRERTRRHADALRPELAAASAKRAMLPDDPATALRRARSERDTADARASAITEAVALVEDAHAQRSQAVSTEQELGRGIAAVTGDADTATIDQRELAGLRALRDRAGELLERRRTLEAERQEANEAVVQAEQALAATLDGFDDASSAAVAAERLRSIAEVVRTTRTRHGALTDELERHRRDEPKAAAVEEALAALSQADEQLATTSNQRVEAATAAEEARSTWDAFQLTNAQIETATAARDRADEAVEVARAELTEANEMTSAAQRLLDQARAEEQVAIAANAAVVTAGHAVEGEPCPVCAQDIPAGFQPPLAPDLETAAARIVEVERDLLAARDRSSSAEAGLSHRRDQQKEAQRALDEALVEFGERRAAIRSWGGSVDPSKTEALDRLIQQSADARTAEELARQTQHDASTLVAAARAAHEQELVAHRRSTEDLTKRLTELAEERARATRQLTDLPAAWQLAPDADDEEIDAGAERLETMVGYVVTATTEVEQVRTRQRQADAAFGDLRVEATEQINGPAKQLVDILERRAGAARSLQAHLVSLGDDATSAPIPALDGEVLLDRIASVTDEAETVAAMLAPVVSEAVDRRRELLDSVGRLDTVMADALAPLGLQSMAELQREAGTARAALDTSNQAAAQAEQAVEHASKLDLVVETGAPYVATLDLLTDSLRDQHFVDHLVSAREVELLAEATRRLKAISGGRYGFVPDFGIVTIASGEVRAADTLSGGERFQAALALALALVEIASRGAGKLEAVFVDEGFGSLDGSALDVALDTLGSVAGGGKLVALISHLRPVAEYVDTVFNVTKDDLFGSTITKLTAEERDALLADDIRSGLTA